MPIILPELLVLAIREADATSTQKEAAWAELRKWIKDEQYRKFLLLAKHYGIENPETDPTLFSPVAFGLAFDYVPGFQVVFTHQVKRGRPRGSGKYSTGAASNFLLEREIADIALEKGTGISHACYVLARR